ncbi:MAG: hypothetical protein IPJ65_14760 [Archangiaceae bacterium]|nr:hypothetical protein [Archangiaceae bacterium]
MQRSSGSGLSAFETAGCPVGTTPGATPMATEPVTTSHRKVNPDTLIKQALAREAAQSPAGAREAAQARKLLFHDDKFVGSTKTAHAAQAAQVAAGIGCAVQPEVCATAMAAAGVVTGVVAISSVLGAWVGSRSAADRAVKAGVSADDPSVVQLRRLSAAIKKSMDQGLVKTAQQLSQQVGAPLSTLLNPNGAFSLKLPNYKTEMSSFADRDAKGLPGIRIRYNESDKSTAEKRRERRELKSAERAYRTNPSFRDAVHGAKGMDGGKSGDRDNGDLPPEEFVDVYRAWKAGYTFGGR